ncbi:hypothetical protein CFS9_42550 [Flavobacterium sp. CFS9]|uniref:Uncharacterized protein n=1 Tax=Flavobacterium sp. CFS9 TaxID=3143118 RepID=A0AAT9H762_9FLAO
MKSEAPPRTTTLKRFLRKRAIYYILPNVCFNFIIAYASFQELGYTHFFAGPQSLARLTLPMAVFLPVILTMDIINRVIVASKQELIEVVIDHNLNKNRFITKLCLLHGIITGLLVLAVLLLAQQSLTVNHKLDPTLMALLDAVLAGVLSILFTYLPIYRLKKHFYKPISRVQIEADIH